MISIDSLGSYGKSYISLEMRNKIIRKLGSLLMRMDSWIISSFTTNSTIFLNVFLIIHQIIYATQMYLMLTESNS